MVEVCLRRPSSMGIPREEDARAESLFGSSTAESTDDLGNFVGGIGGPVSQVLT